MGSLKKWPQHVDSIFKHFRSDYSMQWQKNACNTQLKLNKQWNYLICEEMIASFGFHIPQWLFTAIKIPARHNNNRRKHRNVRKNISYGKFRFEIRELEFCAAVDHRNRASQTSVRFPKQSWVRVQKHKANDWCLWRPNLSRYSIA